ncbi:MAG: rhodanese-like domain-containing protein [bacterium]
MIFFWTLIFFNIFVSAEDSVKTIDIEKAAGLLKKGVAFIDNRPEFKFNRGHIKGAVNLPFFKPGHSTNKMTRENLFKTVGKNKKIVFYCSGKMRAYHAAKQAEKWGLEAKIFWYKQGFEEWKDKKKSSVECKESSEGICDIF